MIIFFMYPEQHQIRHKSPTEQWSNSTACTCTTICPNNKFKKKSRKDHNDQEKKFPDKKICSKKYIYILFRNSKKNVDLIMTSIILPGQLK